MSKIKYYSLDNIKKENAQYNIIIGQRSNGKTYSVLAEIIKKYVEKGEQGAYLRRWQTDIKGLGSTIFDGHVQNGLISELTGGEWNCVTYYSRRFYFCKVVDGEKQNTDSTPFCYTFSLSDSEHDKSTSYPNITTILFDEFLTKSFYLRDEFVTFCNVISTIKRNRTNVKIYMCGNTVNGYCPYFAEMGIKDVKKIPKKTIVLYRYGNSKLKVAVERCEVLTKNKEIDAYFAFDNPKLKMITEGEWELEIYPHLKSKFRPCDILFKFYIYFNFEYVACNILKLDNNIVLFIHKKTTEIKNYEKSYIFGIVGSENYYHRTKINLKNDKLTAKIGEFFINGRVFYDTNETGEMVQNYLNWCKTH